MAAIGAKGFANRKFPLPCSAARQQQACYVHTSNLSQQDRGTEQHHEKQEKAAVVALAARIGGNSRHGAEHGDAVREILAPDLPCSKQKRFPRLAASKAVA